MGTFVFIFKDLSEISARITTNIHLINIKV